MVKMLAGLSCRRMYSWSALLIRTSRIAPVPTAAPSGANAANASNITVHAMSFPDAFSRLMLNAHTTARGRLSSRHLKNRLTDET